MVLERNGELQIEKSSGVKASCAAQAEAIALLQALHYAIDNGIKSCKFFTDSQTLSETVRAWKPPLLVDWRTFKEVFEIWKLLKKRRISYATTPVEA
jgi:ribonuclease HI